MKIKRLISFLLTLVLLGSPVPALAADAGSRQDPLLSRSYVDSWSSAVLSHAEATARSTAQAALVAYPDFTLLDFGGGDNDFKVSEEDINIGISMKKGNTALQSAINEVLSTMTADDYNAMMDDAISVQPLSE